VSEAYRASAAIVVEDASGRGGELLWPVTSWALLGGAFPPAAAAIVTKFAAPTPIQAQAWPIALSGRDMVGIASTGSGKTLAFLMPALVHMAAAAARAPLGRAAAARGPLMLVLAPTRELAMQSADVALVAGAALGLSSTCVFGGVPKGPQAALLVRGEGAHIVVATPGRLLDLLQDGASLARVSYLVLDEADRMLDMGFERDVRAILGAIALPRGARQTLMFSATWPEGVRKIADEFMADPVRVTIGSADLAASHSVTQLVDVLEPHERDRALLRLLEKYHGGAHARLNRVIVFVLYKKEADRVAAFLAREGWANGAIHGDLSQDARTRAYLAFKDASVPILVATDVAARGLDIPNVEFVINYSFPLTIEDYVHRIGRTGRGGKTGTAHTFFTQNDKAHSGELVNILREAGAPLPPDLIKKFGCTVKKVRARRRAAQGAQSPAARG
jgi:ATP-dependent RNA helicase DBP3